MKTYWKKVYPGQSKLKFDNIHPVAHYVCSICGAFGGVLKPKSETCTSCGTQMGEELCQDSKDWNRTIST